MGYDGVWLSEKPGDAMEVSIIMQQKLMIGKGKQFALWVQGDEVFFKWVTSRNWSTRVSIYIGENPKNPD